MGKTKPMYRVMYWSGVGDAKYRCTRFYRIKSQAENFMKKVEVISFKKVKVVDIEA